MATHSELPLDAIRASIKRVERDALFADAHQEEYAALYPDEWVAILDQNVVGHGENGIALIERLRSEGVDVSRVYLHFVPVNSPMFLL